MSEVSVLVKNIVCISYRIQKRGGGWNSIVCLLFLKILMISLKALLYFCETYTYKHPLFSTFSEELTTLCNHFAASLQISRLWHWPRRFSITELAFLSSFWCGQQNLSSKYQAVKSYFCISYSNLLKVETTELKCPNYVNCHSHGGQSHPEHTYSFLLPCHESKWQRWLRSWLMGRGTGNKSQLPWGRWEEIPYGRWCQGLASWHLHQREGLSWDIPRVIGNHSSSPLLTFPNIPLVPSLLLFKSCQRTDFPFESTLWGLWVFRDTQITFSLSLQKNAHRRADNSIFQLLIVISLLHNLVF